MLCLSDELIKLVKALAAPMHAHSRVQEVWGSTPRSRQARHWHKTAQNETLKTKRKIDSATQYKHDYRVNRLILHFYMMYKNRHLIGTN